MDLEPLLQKIARIPENPKAAEHPEVLGFRAVRAFDFTARSRPNGARFLRRIIPYPKPFTHVTFRASDDVGLAGWFAPPQNGSKFGIVIVPGMFASKDDFAHRKRAVALQQTWGCGILVVDMRAFGESRGIATAGWKEALDVMASAKILRERGGCEQIGVIAESMGGAAALNAVAQDSQSDKPLLNGGVLTWSAFVDSKDAVEYISTKPPQGDPFRASWEALQKMLKIRSKGGYSDFSSFMRDAAVAYGLDGVEELYQLANPKWKIHQIRNPTLVVHAVDDPVVPVRHARRVERYCKDLPHVKVIIKPWGKHTTFEAMDEHWYWEVTRQFFSYVNDLPLAPIH